MIKNSKIVNLTVIDESKSESVKSNDLQESIEEN